MENLDCYFVDSGQSHGPVSKEELRKRWRDGLLHSNDLVWQEGMPNWVKASELLGLLPPPIPSTSDDIPAQLAPVRVPTPICGVPTAKLSYAGFWKRLAAFLIDCAVLYGATLAFFFALGFLVGISGNEGALDYVDWEVMGSCGALFVFWLYFAIMESSSHQGTPGKLVLGIKVTDLNGQPISFDRASGRHFGKFLSSILFIGYLIAAVTPKKQAMHDMIAGCLVVNR